MEERKTVKFKKEEFAVKEYIKKFPVKITIRRDYNRISLVLRRG